MDPQAAALWAAIAGILIAITGLFRWMRRRRQGGDPTPTGLESHPVAEPSVAFAFNLELEPQSGVHCGTLHITSHSFRQIQLREIRPDDPSVEIAEAVGARLRFHPKDGVSSFVPSLGLRYGVPPGGRESLYLLLRSTEDQQLDHQMETLSVQVDSEDPAAAGRYAVPAWRGLPVDTAEELRRARRRR